LRINKITLKGFTTFCEEQSLDLAAMGPGLIAFAGPNGAGKTTLLESIPGGIYRQSPSRGNVADLATARDAQIELIGENGSPFTIRLDVDNHSGKSEAVFLDGAGDPMAGPKVRDFDRLIAEKFPSYNVYLAAAFACQTGAGSLLRMERKDRRDLFGKLLGLDRLEDLATAARERGRQAESDLVASRAALEAIKNGAGDVKGLESSLAEAQEKAEIAKTAQKAAADRFRAAWAERDRLTAALDEYKKAELAAREAQRKATEAREALTALEAQENALAPILGKAKEIRAEAEAIRAAESGLIVLEGKARTAAEEATRAKSRADEAVKKAENARRAESELQRKIVALKSILQEGPEIRKQAARLQDLMAERDRIREDGETAALMEREAVEEANIAGRAVIHADQAFSNAERAGNEAALSKAQAEKRIALARQSTGSVPCSGSLSDDERRSCQALNGHFRTIEGAEKELAAIAADESERTERLRIARRESEKWTLESARTKAALKKATDQTEKIRISFRAIKEQVDQLQAKDRTSQLERAEAEAGALKPSFEQATKAAAETNEEARNAAQAAGDAEAAAQEIRFQLTQSKSSLSNRVNRLPELEKAEREAAALQGRLESARPAAIAAAEEAARTRAAVVVVDEEKSLDIGAELEDADSDEQAAIHTANTAVYNATLIEADLNAAREAQRKAEELTAKMAPLEQDASDYRFLARGLGREGVQALELDAAGPQVSTLANELLADAYGSRFQIRFETQAAKADGKGVKETFDIVVVDNERGREGNGEDLSGGEKVIVGEALGLAVGIFHAQAAGVSLGTVVRDETVGALDPENGERYLSMLRAFLRVGKVHQLLFVAHNSPLLDLADKIVRVENGRITV
jgi:exonuclease SbcC